MDNLTVPIAPNISVLINGVPLGGVSHFSEKTVRDLKMLRSLGSTENRGFYRGAEEYILRLHYIMPLNSLLTDAQWDVHDLQDFTVKINLEDRAIVFDSCEYESVETSCDAADCMRCEAVIHALHRTETR